MPLQKKIAVRLAAMVALGWLGAGAAQAQNPDLRLTMSDSPDPALSGATITYALTVENIGAASAANVAVTDTLPEGAAFLSCSVSCALSGVTVTVNLGTLAAAGSTSFNIVVTAPTVTSPTFLRNTATVTTTSTESNTLNNGAAATTTVNPANLAPLVVAGPPGSRINAIAIDPRSTDTVYVAPLGGGIFKSTNGGVNWTAVNSGITVPRIQALAIDPTNPANVYAGEGRSDGARVARSTNGGVTWTEPSTGLTNCCNLFAIAVDPNAPATVYAAANGDFVIGVFKSTDGGVTWNVTGLTNQTVQALASDPSTTPTTIYAGSTGGGVFKSTDGGTNWTTLNTGLSNLNVQALILDRANPGTIYAGTNGGGAFKSTDAGLNWSAVNTGLTNLSVTALVIDPSSPATVYAGTNGGVFKSTNGGGSWTAMNSGLTQTSISSRALVIDRVNPGTLYAGTSRDGLFKTTNGATNWTAINSGLPTSAINTNSLAILPTNPATVLAGRDAGGVARTTNGGASWGTTPFGGQTYSLAIDPAGTAVYQGRSSGGIFKTTDGVTATAINNGITNVTSLSIFALAINPVTPTTIYAGTAFGSASGVFKTTDGGANWTAVNNGITDVGGVVGRGVASLAIDPVNPNTVYAGGFGGFFKTTDGGATWTTLTNGLPSLGLEFGQAQVRALAINPANPQILYAGIWNNPGVGTPGVFKSTNGGLNWTAVNNGLTNRFVRALAIDPSNPSTLYAGTGGGVFKSTDSGANWSPGNLNLDVEALAIDPVTPATIYAGTLGFGVFRSTDGAATWQPTGLSAGSGTGPAATIAKMSGDNQTRGVGQALPAPFAVVVTNASGVPVAGVTVNFTVTAGGGSLSGIQSTTDSQGVALATLTLGPNAGTNNNTVTATATGLAGSPVTFTATGVAPPAINPGGIVNQASRVARAIAPGSSVVISGSNLAFGTFEAGVGGTPVPASLGGVSVSFNTAAAAMLRVSPGQLVVQVPWEMAGQNQASVTVTRDGVTSALLVVSVAAYDPGLYADPSGTGVIFHYDGTFVSATSPVQPGETVILLGTGWGPVTNQPPTGISPVGLTSLTTTTPVVTIGGISAAVSFSGFGGFPVGIYSAKIQIPFNVSLGSAVPVVLTIGGLTSNTVTIPIIPTPTPTFTAAGVVNGASKVGRALAPGSIVFVYGSNLAASTTETGATLPWPTSLGGVSVTFNGIAVPLAYVSASELDLQVPWEMQGQTSAAVIVTNNGVASAAVTVPIGSVDPGLIAQNGAGNGAGFITHASTGQLVTAANPAYPGETVNILGTGFGAVTNQPATGAAALANPPSLTINTPTVTVGGVSATVSFSGLALPSEGPCRVGCNRVAIQVPANAPINNADAVVLTIGGLSSNTVTMAIAAPVYLVGDVYPLLTDLNNDGDRDDAGEFGDGVLNNLDLIQALRAVVNLSRPPNCSDRYDAMDAAPADTTTRGGDGALNNLDLIRTLRRVVNLDSSRPVRPSRSISPCPP